MIKNDFPIFKNHPELIYLDNGATTQKPKIVIDSITSYYENINSNVGRGVYKLAELAGDSYENSRNKIAKFINANSKNIIFTSGATMSLNQVAYILNPLVKKGQKIIISVLEHHANILPWQRLAKEKELELILLKDNEILANPESLPITFWDNVAIIALTHVSNVTGQILPIEKWCNLANQYNIISVIDGAQGVTSERVDVKKINCDFYAFSAHKIYAPTGIGILYIKSKFLKEEPLALGGGIIEDVLDNEYILLDGNTRFEPGTPNVADAQALSVAIDYLESLNFDNLINNMKNLESYLYEKLINNKNISIVNLDSRKYFKHSHIISFNLVNIHAHDVGTFLAEQNIAVRVGKHCTHPLHQALSLNSSVRVSLGIYNTKEDIDKLISGLEQCVDFFKG